MLDHPPALFGCAAVRALRGTGPVGLVVLGALGFLAMACQPRFPSRNVPRMNWLIMPFDQPATMGTDTHAIRGWWLGARTIYQNPRAGVLLAEASTHVMAGLDYVNLYPSMELRDYFARMRDTLKRVYPYLEDVEIDRLMSLVPPVDFARELGADKVLTGRIIRQYMADHRTIHWWWSVLEVDCEVIDVPSGKAEWQRHYVIRDQFASMTTVQEELARQLIEDLQENYFRPLARDSGA
jgi:hypothetical protein